MKAMEDKIRCCGKILPGDVLKVDSFLNHQIDVEFLLTIGEEFYRLFGNEGVTKVLTIEASGIGVACLTRPSCLPKSRSLPRCPPTSTFPAWSPTPTSAAMT